jgi:hypothetical protein
VLRTGYDVRSDDGGTYGKMRTLLHFKHVSLPDGAVIYDTDLQTRVCCLYGNAQGKTVYAYRVTKFWDNPASDPSTWNEMAARYSTTGAASTTVPGSGYMHWDVDSIVSAWYTRTSKAWKADFGFLLKMATESSANGEVEFRRYNDGTTAHRPLLTINFTQPVVGIDFDSRLGPNYAPSSMVAGLATKVPIVVTNKTGSAHTLDKCTDGSDPTCWKVGYRWFDSKGVLLSNPAPATFDLPANVTAGSSSAIIPLTVTAPSTVGQYTLRLDLVHYYSGNYAWASDFAVASKFYSRNKKVLTSDSTRWTGSSAIERDEFSISVVAGLGGGNTKTVAVPSGGAVGIDLHSRNLSLAAIPDSASAIAFRCR